MASRKQTISSANGKQAPMSSSPSTKTATDDVDHRKTFAFRMSKKVAELTQVVHILFVHNHEKEVKMSALIDAYEYEIEQVIADARSRIAAVENQLKKAREVGSRLELEFDARLSQAVANANEESRLKVQSLEQQLNSNNRHVDDEITRIRQQLDHVTAQRAADSSSFARDLAEKSREIERMVRQLRDKEQAETEETKRRLAVELELAEVKRHLADSESSKDSLMNRNRRLEEQLNSLRRQIHQRRSKEIMLPSSSQDSRYDEVERLRQEIRQLKMELSNRETNFNRVFTTHQPIYLSQTPKQRTDLTQQLLRQRNDAVVTSSSRNSTINSRSTAAGVRISAEISPYGSDSRQQFSAGNVSSGASSMNADFADHSPDGATDAASVTRVSFETSPTAASMKSPSSGRHQGLPLLIETGQRRGREDFFLPKPSVPLLAKAR